MKLNPNGFILIDKPCGWTSFDCVSCIKKKYNFNKAGHAGSLDPIATGVMIIMINGATKWFDLFQRHPKIYEATLLLGVSFDTQDITGEISCFEPPDIIPEKKDVIKVLDSFKGSIVQTPPVYSAIKINGRRAYEYARSGDALEMTPRTAHVENVELIDYIFPHISFRVVCKKGFYVRSLCEDIAIKLGSRGVLCALKRVGQSGYKLDEALPLKKLPADIAPFIKLNAP